MHRFIIIARRTDGTLYVRSPEEPSSQLAEIDDAEFIFSTFEDIRTVRLYRIDPDTVELIHVQTWTRDPDVAEAI